MGNFLHLIQHAESDAALLSRLAALYGAVSKPTNGFWLFLEYGAGQTVSGREMVEVTITPEMVSRWNYSERKRDGAQSTAKKKGKVTVNYFDPASGEIKSHEVEHDGTDKIHPHTQPDQSHAQQNAAAKVKRVEKSGRKMSLTMPVVPELVKLTAESRITTQGFGVREDHNWLTESLQFSMSESGFTLEIDLATDISQKGEKGKKGTLPAVDYFG